LRIDQTLERSALSHLQDLQSSERTQTSRDNEAAAVQAPTPPAVERTP
jgi:hypothetical protein